MGWIFSSSLLLFVSGCAGAFGEYGPGMANLSHKGTGVVDNGDGTGTVVHHEYQTGENGYGVQLGARGGYMHGAAGDVASGGGVAIDAHADFTFSRDRFGVGLTGGYTSDQMIGKDPWFYSGLPVGAYGQFLIFPRFFVHAGASYIVMGSLKHVDADKSGDANGVRGFGGLNLVLSRSPSRDFMLRIEGRYTKSQTADVASTQLAWTSTAVLGEIVWASF